MLSGVDSLQRHVGQAIGLIAGQAVVVDFLVSVVPMQVGVPLTIVVVVPEPRIEASTLFTRDRSCARPAILLLDPRQMPLAQVDRFVIMVIQNVRHRPGSTVGRMDGFGRFPDILSQAP